MKIGSLFDGSGTAPLAAAMCGIEPVWASEIEPYPIRVTKARFPEMLHLGSITDISGAEVEPVDIICGGSPCQDLSVAGKLAGLHGGTRSHLFFEMVRIIREMREATNGEYPKYVIWENVPGAFSSNNGNDFLAVLQAFAEIADPNVYVPRPARKGKTDRLAWQYAGTIMGDRYSIAWRTVDAQYWGVPQRRRRIYLVLDLADERAGEILFERKGMSGDFKQSGTQGQETAGDAGRSTEGSCDIQGGNIMNTSEGVTGTLRAQEHGHQPCVVMQYLFENHSQDTRYRGPLDVSPMLPAQLGTGGNNTPFVVEKSQPVYCLQSNGIDRADTAGCNGAGWREGECYTLNTIDRPAVCFSADCRNAALNEELSGTLQSKNGGGYSLNYQNPVVYPFDMQAFGKYGDGTTASTLKQRDYKNATDLVVEDCRIYPGVGITSKQNASNPQPGDPAPTISTDSRNYFVYNTKPPRRYIVRRLTPLECCRLQGFPDWWVEGCEKYPVQPEWIHSGVLEYVDPKGAIEGSDSAKYKMWGNGMALPNMLHVMRGIARCAANG